MALDQPPLQQVQMSSVDRSWLRMESPENPMMISAVLIFEQGLSISRLKRILDDAS